MTQILPHLLSWQGLVGLVITGLLTYLGVRETARTGAKATLAGATQEALQWRFDQLQEEVTRQGEQLKAQDAKLEAMGRKLDETTALNRKALNFIDRVGLANYYGRKLPIPDGVLARHVDMALWRLDNDE